ncbi:MAG: hypothetical protein H6748_11075 [Spirochaetaceae bacterium]|nr:hypothetical protein [Myxococcales bacterium]MCB9724577.1 hypothetical protein [Spirochaetaceae bacterium]HPG25223.1 hypothetical protein [Myxococcota bacterium]
MPAPPRQIVRPPAPRTRPSRLMVLGVALAMGIGAADRARALEPDLSTRAPRPALVATPPERPAHTDPRAPQASDRLAPSAAREAWRATGIAHVDLPLGLRARFEARYTRDRYASERLARPFTTVSTTGPSLDRDAALEGRFALSRPLARGIELEVAWGGRSPVSGFDPLALDGQTVGAAIRITPALLR